MGSGRWPRPGPEEGVGAASTARGLVDWSRVEASAGVVIPVAGPRAHRAARGAVVELLRRGAETAPERVAAITGMRGAVRGTGAGARVLVVDRAGLVRATAGFLARLLDGVPAPPAGPVARQTSAWEAGAVLGALSCRLLGQVLPPITQALPGDAGRPGGAASDRVEGSDQRPLLLLVAPNVLALQRREKLDLADLAAWVTMHEAVHAFQLDAAPWLADHLVARLREEVGAVVEELPGAGPAGIAAIARTGGPGRGEGLAGGKGAGGETGPAELRATLAFLEGHARAVLDGVTPALIPSAHVLRTVLEADPAAPTGRRSRQGRGQGGGQGLIADLLRGRLLRVARAARFSRAVVARAGHEGLNRAWASPWALPTAAELASPEAWLERVGSGAHLS
ncbi:hypothetical protein CHIBA101_0476 [Actinomyces sp. Chiba101]|uniref:zinc-dependent metalloprotease n=1 Tax=Actinomyces TaxID=1654 RepID=UPI000974F2C2|nr:MULTISPECIES: zinc-dependent metalloprotease [Actinomyces]BAW92343.1 hypothetical protein CHIBA101_0476 [Actinomyces sp. Chiba101]GAV94715.1 hypothetical protein ADENT20671_1485 [Actinomyces denticolens]SUU09720.1 Uncharacterized conserved protein [Actinomyces denticolens]